MNNLYRSLAPINDAAWTAIEDEARRTFTRNSTARTVVDVAGPAGFAFSALDTGHVAAVPALAEGVETRVRQVLPVAELRVPFTVTREAIDDVARGSQDSDWQPVKDAATLLAHAEDRAVFGGAEQIRMPGIIPESSNPQLALPADVVDLPGVVARAITQLRSVGVSGDYALVLGSELYTKALETTDHGYPIGTHVERILQGGRIVWAPALSGAVLLTERGGDFELHLGQDVSIGYLSHDDSTVRLYLQESLAFRVNTAEASVVIA
ncbi:family 1 encapsulin nanocompartment shell protein [Granulicoccus phenolivorans]|uniref:family 1 encapsulin nanocompartment shell protein n=1 Tax=Granulicoccus phenolivorans TaxID=266854 RepID=UPI0003F4C93B|nr:family 1 encapsulin nanocompartment shell protein [Granulicoccus phenolivorans]